MFSIWIGAKPGPKEIECLSANNERHGLTLIASKNWIGSKNFKPIEELVYEALQDSRFSLLWNSFPNPRLQSDVLRLWYLIKNPNEIYVDSDCILYAIPSNVEIPLLPSIQSVIKRIAETFKSIPDMDDIKNTSGEWLDVWAIVGNGDSAFFSAWLDLWVKDFFRPGGISEAVSHGPFKVGILATEFFTHFSGRKLNYFASPVLDN